MKYTYFVAYVGMLNFKEYHQNAEVERPLPINSLEEIRELEIHLRKHAEEQGFDFRTIRIINFQLLRAEDK